MPLEINVDVYAAPGMTRSTGMFAFVLQKKYKTSALSCVEQVIQFCKYILIVFIIMHKK